MRTFASVLMMVAVGLAGCTGGSDDAADASDTDVGDEVPTLPEGLEMDGGDVVAYTTTTVVWQWNATIGPGYCCAVRDQAGSWVETTFDVPVDTPVAIEARAESSGGHDDLLGVHVMDASGAAFCRQTQGVMGFADSAACTDYAVDPQGSRWTVRVDSLANADGDIPFTLTLALAVGSQTPAVVADESDATAPDTSRLVLGFDDTGINPYHEAFRDDSPEAYQHPSAYLAGYPADAEALELTLDAPTYVEALAADAQTWDQVQADTLYWIPGTRIVAAIMPDEAIAVDWGSELFCQPVLDCFHHGTAVASRAVAEPIGLCSECKIAVTQGFPAGLEWLVEQTWVDVISISWQEKTESITGQRAHDAALASSKPVFYAAGNGFAAEDVGPGTPTTAWSHQGAPQAISVAGHDNGRVALWPNTVPHIVADACPDIAHHRATAGYYGSCGASFSAPYAAAAGAELIFEARRVLADHAGGVAEGILAEGESGNVTDGPLADGTLTGNELKRLLFTTANPRPPEGDHDGNWCDPVEYPATCVVGLPTLPIEWQTIPEGVPQYYFIGYGAVNNDTLQHAKRVLRGEEPMPERPVEDAFFALDQEVRKALVEVDP